MICAVLAVPDQINGKLARVEVFDNVNADVAHAQSTLNVKLFVRLPGAANRELFNVHSVI